MAPSSLRITLFTGDPALREAVRHATGGPLRLETEIETRYSALSEEAVRNLQRQSPDLVLLDLGHEGELGLRLAQSLTEQNPTLRFLGFGPAPDPEFLLQAMRAGLSEYLTAPWDPAAVRAALERVAQKLGRGTEQQEPGQILAFFGAKGGTGVTTTAANFAILAHRLTSRSTLLLDLDPHLGEAALVLGLEPRYTFIDVIQNFHRLDANLLESYIVRHPSGVDLLSAPFHPEKTVSVTPEQVRRILAVLRDHYAYVIVDVTAFSPAALSVFEAADQLFMLTTVDLPSIRNVQRFLPLLKQRMRRWDEQFRLVVNRQSPQDPISIPEIEDAVGTSVSWRLANDYQPVVQALNTGKPVVLAGNSRYSRDLTTMAVSVLGLSNGKPARRQGRSSLVTRLSTLMRRPETDDAD